MSREKNASKATGTPVANEVKDTEKAVETTATESIIVNETNLEEMENALNVRMQSVEKKEVEISSLNKTLIEKQKDLDQREANLVLREKALENLETSDIEKEVTKGFEFKFEGEPCKFSDDAPKTILFNGKHMTQEEIAKDEEIVLQLIGGNTGLIIKL